MKFLIGILWFLLTVGVLYNIWKKSDQSSSSKLLWTIGILMLPVLGPVAWILFGERTGS